MRTTRPRGRMGAQLGHAGRVAFVVLRRAGVLAVLLLALVAAPAHAECDEIRWETRWQPDPFGTSGGSLIRVPVCVTKDGSKPKPKAEKKQRKEPTKAQYRTLRFTPSETVSATVRQRMIDQLAHGEQAEQVRNQIGSGDLMRQFGEAMGAMKGWSGRDYGDVYALAYIQMWLGVNDVRRTSDATDKAVREQLRRQLALDPKVRRAKDAVQQENAEWLASWTVVLLGSLQHLRTLGDPAAVERFRENAKQLISSTDLLGVDLTEVKLTRRGIQRR
jgi:hypothetical protein